MLWGVASWTLMDATWYNTTPSRLAGQQYYFNPGDIDLFDEDQKSNDILFISFASFCGIHLPASKLANAPAAISKLREGGCIKKLLELPWAAVKLACPNIFKALHLLLYIGIQKQWVHVKLDNSKQLGQFDPRNDLGPALRVLQH